MRIVFALNTLGFLRHFERALAELVNRGHQIRLVTTDKGEGGRIPAVLEGNKAVVAFDGSVSRRGPLGEALRVLRSTRDYLRYHEPAFATRDLLRRRALDRLAEVLSGGSRELDSQVARWHASLTDTERARLSETFTALEDAVPSEAAIDRLLLAQRADVLLVTPLITFGSILPEWVKSARRLGIPVGFPVFSWDNLSTKGVIHEIPDRVFVWNAVQERELIEMHNVPAERVVITGASRFDDFFRMEPSEKREAFCRRLAFAPEHPIVTYLGSSPMVSPNEPRFVEAWIARLRASNDAQLRNANILVRPHPRCEDQWRSWRAPAERVGVFHTSAMSSDQVLFDCLYYGSAVVGLNTSAQLEAGIVGKPVLTIVAPEWAPGQLGTLHYEYLLARNGGFVQEAGSLDEHVDQLSAVLTHPFDRSATDRFIEGFLRPAGLSKPVSPIFADAVESLASLAIPRSDPSVISRLGRRLGLGQPEAAEAAVAAFELREAKARADRLKEKTRELRRELKKRHGITPGSRNAPDLVAEVPVDYRGADLRIVTASDTERKWAQISTREPAAIQWIDTVVTAGDVMYDVGAGVGVLSLIAAARLSGRGTVVAVEPSAPTFARLCENIVLNGFESIIVPVPVPLAATETLSSFAYRDRQPGQTRHLFDGTPWQPGVRKAADYTQPVLTVTLDHLVNHFNLPAPTLIKLDVDGAEMQVLLGARATLRSASVRSLIVELRGNEATAIARMLEDAGLKLSNRHEHAEGSGSGRSWAAIFTRP
jgi:FkbM family methyltransferase